MARLNEPPVSTDSLETLRKKLLRQNRDLAKSNNVRALRIRELENECACMLSENLELRGRILELEKEVEDNDSRRIADHALAIKDKLESQLTEWGILLAGLGLEPPMKRHSPRIRKSAKSRLSFSSARPSPSQRRLRDIAKDIEELGSIAENKSYPRRSMNPEQILALRSEADSVDSPELGPPPMSQFIDCDPVKVDSPSQTRSVSVIEPSPKKPELEVSPTLPSPQKDELVTRSPSPKKKAVIEVRPQEPKIKKLVLADKPTTTAPPPPPQPAKAGSKRKLAARDEVESSKPQRTTNENLPPKSAAEKQSIREKAGGRTLKELASIRKEAREKGTTVTAARKPLTAKDTNEDMTSPKKTSKPTIFDEVAAAKADLPRSAASQEQKLKPKTPVSITIETVLTAQPVAPKVTSLDCELGTPLNEAALLSPSSPEPEALDDGLRGATPPPADVNSTREPAGRLSRRNRTAVSYAEPNLRDKMRRPRKELYDAVSGEGKYARRSSQADSIAPDSVKIKPEMDAVENWKNLPMSKNASIEQILDNGPASPLAGKGSHEDLPTSVVMDRRRRVSTVYKDVPADENEHGKEMDASKDQTINVNSSDVDVYEFDTSSPQQAKPESKKRPAARKGTRRMSAIQNEELPIRERASSRRRSMMI